MGVKSAPEALAGRSALAPPPGTGVLLVGTFTSPKTPGHCCLT